MKRWKIFFAALSLAGSLWAGNAPFATYPLNGSRAELNGMYADLGMTGTVTYVTYAAAPSYPQAATSFSVLNYFSLPADALAALTNTGTSYSIEYDIFLNSIATSPCPVGNGIGFFQQVNSSGWRWQSVSAGDLIGLVSVISTGVWHTFLSTFDGSNKGMYVDRGVYVTPVAKVGTIAGIALFTIGQSFSIGVDGYLSNVRLYAGAQIPGSGVNKSNMQRRMQ